MSRTANDKFKKNMSDHDYEQRCSFALPQKTREHTVLLSSDTPTYVLHNRHIISASD